LRIVSAQTLSPIPGSIQDAASGVPITESLSFEQQIQNGTQGNPSNRNPFAYAHGVQIRPWVHYDGIPNTTITSAISYIYNFTVPGTSDTKHPEWRFTAFGTLRQTLSGGSVYEQLRFELLNFRSTDGEAQHLPRVRFRLGQNLFLSEGRLKPYLGLYEEAIVQFPQPSYSRVHFQGARFFAGYGFQYGERAKILLGFKSEAEVSTSGSTVTLFYGPVFSIDYRFTTRPVNEKHKRTTAFKDF
jgi:hypothetical protein